MSTFYVYLKIALFRYILSRVTTIGDADNIPPYLMSLRFIDILNVKIGKISINYLQIIELFPIFAVVNIVDMKYTEFHRLIRRNGWVALRQSGSHVIYEKDGYPNKSVPDHGSKEIPEGLRLRLSKEMGL